MGCQMYNCKLYCSGNTADNTAAFRSGGSITDDPSKDVAAGPDDILASTNMHFLLVGVAPGLHSRFVHDIIDFYGLLRGARPLVRLWATRACRAHVWAQQQRFFRKLGC